MIDGDPAWPGLDYQWRLAAETEATHIGVPPVFLMRCRKAGVETGCAARTCASSSPPARRCPAEGFHYVYEQLGPDVLLLNGSGGTDVCSALVTGHLMAPVYEGEIAEPLPGRGRQGVRPRRRRGASASWASW